MSSAITAAARRCGAVILPQRVGRWRCCRHPSGFATCPGRDAWASWIPRDSRTRCVETHVWHGPIPRDRQRPVHLVYMARVSGRPSRKISKGSRLSDETPHALAYSAAAPDNLPHRQPRPCKKVGQGRSLLRISSRSRASDRRSSGPFASSRLRQRQPRARRAAQARTRRASSRPPSVRFLRRLCGCLVQPAPRAESVVQTAGLGYSRSARCAFVISTAYHAARFDKFYL